MKLEEVKFAAVLHGSVFHGVVDHVLNIFVTYLFQRTDEADS